MCHNCKKDDCPDSSGLMHCKCHKDSKQSRPGKTNKYGERKSPYDRLTVIQNIKRLKNESNS